MELGGGENKAQPTGQQLRARPSLGSVWAGWASVSGQGPLAQTRTDRSHGVEPTGLSRMCVRNVIPSTSRRYGWYTWLVPKSRLGHVKAI